MRSDTVVNVSAEESLFPFMMGYNTGRGSIASVQGNVFF